MNLYKMNGKRITYQNKRFQGEVKTIARLLNKHDQVVEVAFVGGENNFLAGYLALKRKVGKESRKNQLARQARRLLNKGMKQKEIAAEMGIGYVYLNQLIMLFQLK